MTPSAAPVPLVVAALVVAAWSGCLGDGASKGGAAVDDPAAVGGNLTVDKQVSVPIRLVDLPLGKGDMGREYRDPQTIPDPLDLFDSRSTRFSANVFDLWPTSDLEYQVWLVDEEANKTLRSPLFGLSGQGSREKFEFEIRGPHLKTYNLAYVTLEADDDDRRGLEVLTGTFADGEAKSTTFAIAGSLGGVVSQGMLQAGKGTFTLAFAATGVPAVPEAEYRVWLELGNETKDLGVLERDENETDSWSFAAAEIISIPGSLFVETAKFAVTLEPGGNKDEAPSGAVVMRVMPA